MNFSIYLNRIKKIISQHPIITLISLILLTSAIVFFPYLFRKEIFIFSDVGLDTANIYYPFFASLQRKFANGDFTFWDFTYGLGTNDITRQVDLGNIFTWITCLFGKDKLKYALVLVHILKVIISGIICYFYLDCFKISNKAKITASYVFAFNGFTMLWGQHYFFGSACALICFLLLAVEKCFVSKKGYLLLSLATFFAAFNSYYYAYMMLMVTAVYAIFRLISKYRLNQTKEYLSKIGLMLCSVILGVGMAACLFLPSIYSVVSTSARLSKDSIFDTIKSYLLVSNDNIDSIISRFFSNNFLGTADYPNRPNYYELPQWFFSSFMAFFGCLFVTDTITDNSPRKIKIVKLSGVALILILAFHPLLSVILNGFVAPVFRYTYLIMPLFALCMAQMLEKLFKNKLKYPKFQILLAGLFQVFCLLFCIKTVPDGLSKFRNFAVIYLAMSLLLILFMLLSAFKKLGEKSILSFMAILLIFSNVATDSYITNNFRTTISEVNPKIYYPSGNFDVQSALEYINNTDNSFARTEKTFQDIAYLNDSLLQGYYGASVYNSVVNKNITEFTANVCPEFKPTTLDCYYDFKGIFYNPKVTSLLGVKYILSDFYIENTEDYEYINTFGNVLLYRNKLCDGIGKFYSKAITYNEYSKLTKEQKNDIINDTLIMDKTFIQEPAENSYVKLYKPDKSNNIKGYADIKQNGYMMLSIPNEDGWTAYIDGKEAKIETADYAFMAIAVSKGVHTVELKYKTPLFLEGLIVSVISLAVFVLLWILIDRKEKSLVKIKYSV